MAEGLIVGIIIFGCILMIIESWDIFYKQNGKL